MIARRLAADLSLLSAAERDQLLDELPPERRAELRELLQQIAGLEDAPAVEFESHMAKAEAATQAPSFPALNDGQLRLLLASENPSVQTRISALVRNGRLSELAPAVKGVVDEYLARRLSGNRMEGPSEPEPRQSWWRRRKAR